MLLFLIETFVLDIRRELFLEPNQSKTITINISKRKKEKFFKKNTNYYKMKWTKKTGCQFMDLAFRDFQNILILGYSPRFLFPLTTERSQRCPNDSCPILVFTNNFIQLFLSTFSILFIVSIQ